VTRLVLRLDCDDTVGITRVALLNPGRLARQGRDRNRGEGAALVQRRCKRDIDLVPWYEIARGLAGVWPYRRERVISPHLLYLSMTHAFGVSFRS
jgi:hypothetical protein